MARTPIIRSPMRPARKGEAPTVEWAQWVEKSLRRLIDEPPFTQRPITGGSDLHPWRIFAAKNGSSCRVHVWRGACTAHLWAWNDTDVYGETLEITAGIGAGAMISESVPIGNVSAGYLTLSASTTYGIWLMVGAYNNFPAASVFNPISGLFPDGLTVHFQTFTFGTAAIHANSTNIDHDDSLAMSGVSTVETKNLAIYLGKVVVDADGNGVVTQYRKSDADVHAPLLTAPVVVSTDTSGGANTIGTGSDGGAYLP